MVEMSKVCARVSWSNYSISVFSIFFHYSRLGFFREKKPEFFGFFGFEYESFLAIFSHFFVKKTLKTRYFDWIHEISIRKYYQIAWYLHNLVLSELVSRACNQFACLREIDYENLEEELKIRILREMGNFVIYGKVESGFATWDCKIQLFLTLGYENVIHADNQHNVG